MKVNLKEGSEPVIPTPARGAPTSFTYSESINRTTRFQLFLASKLKYSAWGEFHNSTLSSFTSLKVMCREEESKGSR